MARVLAILLDTDEYLGAKEIGEALDVSAVAVRQAVFRARQRLPEKVIESSHAGFTMLPQPRDRLRRERDALRERIDARASA